jgi:hypothetical protein
MRFLDVFVERLDLQQLGFNRVETAVERRPTSHLGDLLKLDFSCKFNHRKIFCA